MAIEFVNSDGRRPTAIRTLVFRSKAPKKLTAFYYALGLQVASQKTDAGEAYMAKCNGALLRFVPHPNPPPEEVAEFGFVVDDLEQALVALQAQGGRVIGEQRIVRGRPFAKVADPDGRRLSLFEAVPATDAAVGHDADRVAGDERRDEIEAMSDGVGLIIRGMWLRVCIVLAVAALVVAVAFRWLDLPEEWIVWILLGLIFCSIPCEILIIVGKFRCLGDSGKAKGWLYTSIAFHVIGLLDSVRQWFLPGPGLDTLCGLAAMLTFLFFVRAVAKGWRDRKIIEFANMLLVILAVCLSLVIISLIGIAFSPPGQYLAAGLLLVLSSFLLIGCFVGNLVFLYRLRALQAD